MRPDAARGKRQPARPQQPDEESFEESDGIGSEVRGGVVCVCVGWWVIAVIERVQDDDGDGSSEDSMF